MRILTRYIIRAHVGPFLFAFSAVTGLLFLNAVAQRLEDLVGKGLEASVMLEFLVLSLPHIVALTFPMSILVAVLYVFSDMTGNNEVTALAAGGVHPVRLLAPLLGVGIVLTGTMFYFNDQVLPESNHSLSSLLSDVGSKSPTFELREQVINEVHTDDRTRYFLRAAQIDQATNRLIDVEIYDLTRAGETRTIVADRGEMAFTPDGSDLYLTLVDGIAYSTTEDQPGGFRRLDFERQIIPFRGVGAQLERRTGGEGRSDREMTSAMLSERVAQYREGARAAGEEMREISHTALDDALAPPRERDLVETDLLHDPVMQETTSRAQATAIRWNLQRTNVFRYQVEIYKKQAISAACIIFILLGVPMAIRYPQGGVGMVIALSVGIFFLYWVGLIVGERFADRGQLYPWFAMWLPNLILLVPGLYLTLRMGRQMSTTRGSRLDELRYRTGVLLGRLVGRKGGDTEEVGEGAAA